MTKIKKVLAKAHEYTGKSLDKLAYVELKLEGAYFI